MSDTAGASLPLGIRGWATAGDTPFMAFFDKVQQSASSLGCAFFLFCGEDGHDLITDEIDCQNLTGWLVPMADVPEFSEIFPSIDLDNAPDRFDRDMVSVEWDGTSPADITVSFDHFNR